MRRATSLLGAGVRARSRPRAGLLVAVLLVAVLLVVGACASEPPSPSGVPSPTFAAVPVATATATASPTASPSPSPTPSPSASPTASPSPGGIAGAQQVPCPGSTGKGSRGRVGSGTSRNWAGYIIGTTRSRVTCVEGTWTQPSVRCAASGRASVAIWVGIDGVAPIGGMPDASATLAQTGTMVDCIDGSSQVSAWFEFLPDLREIQPFQLTVNAGDQMWAQVRFFGHDRFRATLIDLTQGIGVSQDWHLVQAPLLTAEWIVEAPASRCSGANCTILPLARFSTVGLNGYVTIGGARYRLSAAPFPYLRTTISRSGRTLAAPSSLSTRGFTVTWKAS